MTSQLLAVLAATVAAFVSGGAYYAALGAQLAEVSSAAAAGEPPPPWKLAAELARCLLLAAVSRAWRRAATRRRGLLGLVLWIGFPFVLWTGAMIHEDAPWRLAVIHGGDWLVKLLLVAVIVSVWP